MSRTLQPSIEDRRTGIPDVQDSRQRATPPTQSPCCHPEIGALAIVPSPTRESLLVSQRIQELAAKRGELSILEAGCGTAWPLKLPGVHYHLTGIDLNEDALQARLRNQGDLERAILGDLTTATLEDGAYDVVYNSFVLEHVHCASQALDNFYRWLAPGGLLILRIPDRRSVYGMLSRITPFWVHVAYKRYIAGSKTAGKPGYDPFPTVYDEVVSREGIHGWCAAHGMTIREEVGWNYAISRPGLRRFATTSFIRMLRMLSLGVLAADHINLTYVIEKPRDHHREIHSL